MHTGRGLHFCCLLVISATSLFGQSAELSGFVKDPSGGFVTGAQLQLRNTDTGIRYQEITDSEGFYSFASVKPGTYEASIQANKFRTLTQQSIVLNVDERASLDFSLQLAIVAQSVTVNSQAPLLNSTDPAVSTLVDQQFVRNMPLNGRSFQSLIALTPGVVFVPTTNSAGGTAAGQFSVNGQRANANYFMIDGVSANFGVVTDVGFGQTLGGAIPSFNAFGATSGLVSVDAMQEFRVLTSTFAPEYGRTPGAQVLILTRSGTNQFHGTAFDYLRNDIFDARNFFNMVPQPKPPLRQNDFGGTVGGPIRKNKTFFFFSYEGLRLRLPETSTGSFLAAAARENVAPAYKPILAALPLPNGPVNSDGITANLTTSYSDPSNLNATSLRIDQTFNERVTFFARYNHAPSDSFFHYFSELDDMTVNTDTATIGLTILVTPTKLNEFRANWSRQTADESSRMVPFYGAVPPPLSALYPPAYSTSDQFVFVPPTGGEVRTGYLAANVQQQWNLVDTFSVTTGGHQLKFGLDFRRLNLTSGLFNSFLAIANSYSSLQSGIADVVAQSAEESIPARVDNYSSFGQGVWKLSPSLTLTYGLRWDINTPPASTAAGKPLYALTGVFDSQPFGLAPAGTPLWHTRFNNFAPRVGAAWQLSPKTVLRGGYGLFYDLGYGGGIFNTGSFPYERDSSVSSVPFNLNNPAFTPPALSVVAGPDTAWVYAVDPHLRTPLTYEWNVTIERAFGANQRLSASYVGAYGKHLLREDSIQQTPATYPTMFATTNGDWSHYSALQVQFQRRMARGLQALASYTLAKSTDTNSTDVCQCSYTNTLSNVNPAADLGPADFDVRNSFSAAVSYQLPAPPGRLGHTLFGNWTLDTLVRSSSAPPFSVMAIAVSPVFGRYYTRADIVPGVPFYVPDANNPGGRRLNPAAFSVPPGGEQGNSPRNHFRLYPLTQADIALSRRFKLSERVVLYARAEYFNVFNHPNFGLGFLENYINYGGGTPNPNFGITTATLNNTLGGLNPLYQVGGPRSAQFTLKFMM
ncbi:MAG: TonB-dependent receptor [Acidobacteriaceae bacterium]|nr:TonB-dependent receptor [Acidobacteriaceae bacterium]